MEERILVINLLYSSFMVYKVFICEELLTIVRY